MFFRHWGTSLQSVGSGPWSGNPRSCWLEASLFLGRHLGLDFRHLAFLRLLLTAQNCWSIFVVYSTKRCIFVQKRPNFRWNNSREVISVPFCKMKLDINIFRGWDNIPPSSAYVFIKSPISFLPTKVFLNIGGKLAKFTLKFSGTSMSHWT